MWFWPFYVTKRQADLALSQYDNRFIQENGIEYIAVIKTWFPIFNYKLEFGLSNGTIVYCKKKKWKKDGILIESKLSFEYSTQGALNKKIKSKSKFIRTSIKFSGAAKRIEENDYHGEVDKSEIALFGSSISREGLPRGGTLGAIFQLKHDSNFYGLSNWHVLLRGSDRLGSKIYHPRLYGVGSCQTMRNQYFGKAIWGDINESLEAAIFRIENLNKIGNKIVCNDKALRGIKVSKFRQKVFMCGFASGELKSKMIRSTNVTVKAYIETGFNKIFRNQIQLRRFTESGDSGAIIFTKSGYAVGLVFAHSTHQTNSFTYANPLENIFNTKFQNRMPFQNEDGSIKHISTLKFDKFTN